MRNRKTTRTGKGIVALPIALVTAVCVCLFSLADTRLSRVEAKEKNQQGSQNLAENEEENKEEEYLELTRKADDDRDFRYATDYVELSMIKYRDIRDAKNYDLLYGYSNVSVEDIQKVLKKNRHISREYKEFITEYVEDWLELYPGSDFSTFCHNLETMKIETCTKDEMMFKAVGADSVACYKKSLNTVYLIEGIDLRKDSDDYIILTHELTHAARNTNRFLDKDGYRTCVSFINEENVGLYVEEALITDFCYELQGLGRKSNFYTLQSSYFRIILDAIDYDGADFMNHSVNYLIEQMDRYMGDKQYAYKMINLIDAEAESRYGYTEPEYTEYSELYQYITKMYVKNHITAGMRQDEVQKKYEELIAEITYYFDKAKRPFELDLSIFTDEFNRLIRKSGYRNVK
ncbi:MAG: hypothetical protein J5979_08525 [Lachnospiraceae bacterium]|nr:hypothetical protein [Lachnospiraceae bacterium]